VIISLIVAAAQNNVIGKNNTMPWHLPDDLKHFRTLTDGHVIIMGRKCFESIGKPLPNRRNIIITRDQTYEAPGCEVSSSYDEAVMFAGKDHPQEIFVIGGGEIYKLAMKSANRIYMTRVHADIDGDIYFPEIDPALWKETEREEHLADERHPYPFSFETFERKDVLAL